MYKIIIILLLGAFLSCKPTQEKNVAIKHVETKLPIEFIPSKSNEMIWKIKIPIQYAINNNTSKALKLESIQHENSYNKSWKSLILNTIHENRVKSLKTIKSNFKPNEHKHLFYL